MPRLYIVGIDFASFHVMKNYLILLILVLFLFEACTFKPPELEEGIRVFVIKDDPSVKKGDWENSVSVADGAPLSSADDMPIRDWESSGGDGILCFGSQETLEKGESFFKDAGFLEENLISFKILERHQYFEKSKEYKIWTELQGIEEEKEIVQKVLKRLSGSDLDWAQKIELALENINTENLLPIYEDLSLYQDSAPLMEIEKKCGLVQISVREKNDAEDSIFQTKVYFDEFYYERLSKIDRAMLISHEALYLIAKKDGDVDSDVIRKLNVKIFSDSTI